MTDSGTPRLCQRHFGMDDRPCLKGCGEICIVAEPEKVNAELSRFKNVKMPEVPHYFNSDGYRDETGVQQRFVLKYDYDALLTFCQSRRAEIERLRAELQFTHDRAEAAELRAQKAEHANLELANISAASIAKFENDAKEAQQALAIAKEKA